MYVLVQFIIKYLLDVVLDLCIIYRLLLVLTQRDVLYRNYYSQPSLPHQALQEPQEQNFKMLCRT